MIDSEDASQPWQAATVSLGTICREWTRIGCIGFGGPPTHVALLRRMCVEERHWLAAREFEDGISATNLLPGPASTQLAIFCAWRLRGAAGAVEPGHRLGGPPADPQRRAPDHEVRRVRLGGLPDASGSPSATGCGASDPLAR